VIELDESRISLHQRKWRGKFLLLGTFQEK
jgi:hypothetical protein